MILDGTLPAIDRIAADRLYYSGKHKRHGMNVQVIADPFGRLLWASPALPETVHDIRAARTHRVIAALTEADLRCWADKGYQGVVLLTGFDTTCRSGPENASLQRRVMSVSSGNA
ncbi:hypothetical protein SUDANB1_00056 [Streptomyces sp. enrichment culture]